MVAELLQLAADAKSLLLRRDEQAHALVPGLRVRIGLHQQRDAVALDAVGDPGLHAVDDVVVAVAPRRGADRLQVGAGIRLGQRRTRRVLRRSRATAANAASAPVCRIFSLPAPASDAN